MARDLKTELNSFHTKLKQFALPGFMDWVTDTYFDETYKTYAEELEYLGEEMRRAVSRGDAEHFDLCRNHYKKIYSQVNVELAKTIHADLLDHYLDQNMENEEAEKLALEHVWQNPNMRRWLPAWARLRDDSGKREVYLVGHEDHIPKGKNYVTISEIKSLEKSGRDPWKFVQNRSAS